MKIKSVCDIICSLWVEGINLSEGGMVKGEAASFRSELGCGMETMAQYPSKAGVFGLTEHSGAPNLAP